MINRIVRFPVVLTCFVFMSGYSGQSAGASSQPASAKQIATWIQQLADDNFSVREKATRHLLQAGRAAVKPVAEAIMSDNLEVSWRAGAVLEQIGIAGDERTIAEVLVAIDQLNDKGKKRLGNSFDELAQRWSDQRNQRAIAAIRDLGGEVIEMPGGVAFDGWAQPWPQPRIQMIQPVRPRNPGDRQPLDVDQIREQMERVIEDLEAIEVEDPFEEPADAELEDAAPGPNPFGEPLQEPVEENLPQPEDQAIKKAVEALKRFRPKRAPADVQPDADAPVIIHGGGIAIWEPQQAGSPTHTVRLGKTWQGTDEDLRWLQEINGLISLELTDFEVTDAAIRQFAKLPFLQRLTVDNSQFKPASLLQFKKERPEVTLYAVGTALLGISGTSGGGHLAVRSVVPASGAANAGIQFDDVIESADGIPVTSIDELTVIVAQKKVGDGLNLTIRRDNKVIETKATLGSRADLAF